MPLAVSEITTDDELTYAINWKKWLNGRTIATSVWEVTAPIVNISSSFTPDTALIKVKIPTGELNTTYSAKNTITTADGEKKAARLSWTVVEP